MINLSEQIVSVNHDLINDLDYWEVDPDWDGQTFRSSLQAVRPHKKGSIPTELMLPQPTTEKTIAVRMVMIDSEQTQIILPG